jgi:3-dehydro-L-gulonate 2-dehydrogenase
MEPMFRVPFDDLFSAFEQALIPLGFAPARAELCARLFTETTRDGVYTHGLNRFPRFVGSIRYGCLYPDAEPVRVAAFGGLERWDGRLGPGNLNAHSSILRAMELARQHGLGCVALANTNHWMRGGTYGWIAADAGLFALCWSNTLPNVPAWGATNPVLGNNPLVIALPRPDPDGKPAHVVLDMAMSQFSYGALASYSKRGEPLPVDGGFDTAGNLTRNAAAIEASQRALPIGYWKGSGLSLVLDMVGAMLAGGIATWQIPPDPPRESRMNQIFLVIDPSNVDSAAHLTSIADGILDNLHGAHRADPNKPIRYPGEETLRLREENLRLGIPVDPDLWEKLKTQTI